MTETQTAAAKGLDVSGQRIDLGELQEQMRAAGVVIPYGLVLVIPDIEPGNPMPMHHAPKYDALPKPALLYTRTPDGQDLAELPDGAAAVVAAHIPTALLEAKPA